MSAMGMFRQLTRVQRLVSAHFRNILMISEGSHAPPKPQIGDSSATNG